MKTKHFNPEFVEFIPHELEDGVIYVTLTYGTAVHLCPCGCGSKVPTPITPADWHLLYDGVNVSLSPSVGNWDLPCRSHYLIKGGEVLWAEPWTKEQIQSGRKKDDRGRAALYGGDSAADLEATTQATQPSRRTRRWLRRRP